MIFKLNNKYLFVNITNITLKKITQTDNLEVITLSRMRIIVKEINSYHFHKVIFKLILPSNSGHEALVSTILAGVSVSAKTVLSTNHVAHSEP